MNDTTSTVRKIALIGIMVAMLFVVLSTATYAWYSANNVATVDNVTFTSSSNDSEGGLLAIGTDLTDVSTNLTFDAPKEFSPMIPVSESVVGETTYSEFVAGFNKTSEGLDPFSEWVAKLDGTAITPITLSAAGQDHFYVINRSQEDDFRVIVDYMFDETDGTNLKDKLHIAFFIGEDTDAVLLGIATLSDVHYGAIHAGDKIADTPVMQNGVKKTSGEMSFLLPASQHAALRLVVWLDGVDMKNEHGNRSMIFSLTFRGESV